jgi:hypothetical protein
MSFVEFGIWGGGGGGWDFRLQSVAVVLLELK